MSMILQSTQPLTKTKDAQGRTVRGYPNADLFRAHPRRWDCLDDVHKDLLWLQSQKNGAVIRGQLTELGRSSYVVRRRAHQDPKHFEPADRDWIALDIDGARVPEELSQGSTGQERARWLLDVYLPEVCRDVSSVVQWTASEGWDLSLV